MMPLFSWNWPVLWPSLPIFMDKQKRGTLPVIYKYVEWVPSPRFLGSDLEDLTHQSVFIYVRKRAHFSGLLLVSCQLLTDLQKGGPDLYRGGLEPIRGQALFGFLLGVLE